MEEESDASKEKKKRLLNVSAGAAFLSDLGGISAIKTQIRAQNLEEIRFSLSVPRERGETLSSCT